MGLSHRFHFWPMGAKIDWASQWSQCELSWRSVKQKKTFHRDADSFFDSERADICHVGSNYMLGKMLSGPLEATFWTAEIVKTDGLRPLSIKLLGLWLWWVVSTKNMLWSTYASMGFKGVFQRSGSNKEFSFLLKNFVHRTLFVWQILLSIQLHAVGCRQYTY